MSCNFPKIFFELIIITVSCMLWTLKSYSIWNCWGHKKCNQRWCEQRNPGYSRSKAGFTRPNSKCRNLDYGVWPWWSVYQLSVRIRYLNGSHSQHWRDLRENGFQKVSNDYQFTQCRKQFQRPRKDDIKQAYSKDQQCAENIQYWNWIWRGRRYVLNRSFLEVVSVMFWWWAFASRDTFVML